MSLQNPGPSKGALGNLASDGRTRAGSLLPTPYWRPLSLCQQTWFTLKADLAASRHLSTGLSRPFEDVTGKKKVGWSISGICWMEYWWYLTVSEYGGASKQLDVIT